MKTTLRPRVAQRVVLPKLEQNILRVILYFNVFDHPLTADEIYTYLPMRASSPAAVARALLSLERRSHIRSKGVFHFLATASDRCASERTAKELRAVRRLVIARLVGRFIGLFPFVQAVMLSGELSKGVAGPASDIDFVVVAKKRRLWICRSILIAFKKIFLFNSKKYFCLNHFIDDSTLVVDARNYYSALELATLKPLMNPELHARYLAANRWISEFFPNLELPEVAGEPPSHLPVRSLPENVIPREWADRIDVFLMTTWQGIWNRRYAKLSEPERNHMFRCLPGMSTAYGEDFQKKVLNRYAYRLRQYGLPPLGHSN
jgi:hypothetical protein